MSAKDVQYERYSLKQCAKGNETEIIREASVEMKADSAECSQEYKGG